MSLISFISGGTYFVLNLLLRRKSFRQEAIDLSRQLIKQQYLEIVSTSGKYVPKGSQIEIKLVSLHLKTKIRLDYFYHPVLILIGIYDLVDEAERLPEKHRILKRLKKEIEHYTGPDDPNGLGHSILFRNLKKKRNNRLLFKPNRFILMLLIELIFAFSFITTLNTFVSIGVNYVFLIMPILLIELYVRDYFKDLKLFLFERIVLKDRLLASIKIQEKIKSYQDQHQHIEKIYENIDLLFIVVRDNSKSIDKKKIFIKSNSLFNIYVAIIIHMDLFIGARNIELLVPDIRCKWLLKLLSKDIVIHKIF